MQFENKHYVFPQKTFFIMFVVNPILINCMHGLNSGNIIIYPQIVIPTLPYTEPKVIKSSSKLIRESKLGS